MALGRCWNGTLLFNASRRKEITLSVLEKLTLLDKAGSADTGDHLGQTEQGKAMQRNKLIVEAQIMELSFVCATQRACDTRVVLLRMLSSPSASTAFLCWVHSERKEQVCLECVVFCL